MCQKRFFFSFILLLPLKYSIHYIVFSNSWSHILYTKTTNTSFACTVTVSNSTENWSARQPIVALRKTFTINYKLEIGIEIMTNARTNYSSRQRITINKQTFVASHRSFTIFYKGDNPLDALSSGCCGPHERPWPSQWLWYCRMISADPNRWDSENPARSRYPVLHFSCGGSRTSFSDRQWHEWQDCCFQCL